MKRSLQRSFAIFIVFFWINLAWGVQGERDLTTTLLPVEEKVLGEKDSQASFPEQYLWIQLEPKKSISLQFDLKGLPSDLKEFKTCSLRVVAQNYAYKPKDNEKHTGGGTVSLTGKLPLASRNVVAFNAIGRHQKKSVAVGRSERLCEKIKAQSVADNGDRLFTINLESESDKAGALFYSSKAFNNDPSNIPRLVITYTLGPPGLLESTSWSQHQQNPEHTGRNPWMPFQNPTGFTIPIQKIPKDGMAGSIADYPLIHRGNFYLVNKVEKQNYLVALNFKGKELWREKIGTGTVQRSPVISRNGIFYVVTEKQITGYDLNRPGEIFASYPKSGALTGKLSAYTDLTIGNDGSLFLALKENAGNYIYGFTPDLKPFLKSVPLGKGQDKISTVTVSPDGQKIFAQTPKGAVRIDITDPSPQKPLALDLDHKQPKEYYHVPIATPNNGTVFSAFTINANKGNVWGTIGTDPRWVSAGTLTPQPILGSNPNHYVYFIQGGALQGHQYDQLGAADISKGEGLNATSNLVMDGADNIYFWDNGYLHGYHANGEFLFKKQDFTSSGLKERPVEAEVLKVEINKAGRGYAEAPKVTFEGGGGLATAELDQRIEESSGPEQFTRLMMGPDGTLWANNKNGDALYAFKPSYKEADLTLKQEDIKHQTVYRATGRLTVDKLTVGGEGATATAEIVEGAVTAITITHGGQGYKTPPTVTIEGGEGATATAQIVEGVVTAIAITDGGQRYKTPPTVTVIPGAQVLFQAQNTIGFARGFKVKKGASILARTGF